MAKVILKCCSCGEKATRQDHDPYTGHLHDSSYEYVCSVCRGTMRDVTHLEGAVCECDKALRDYEYLRKIAKNYNVSIISRSQLRKQMTVKPTDKVNEHWRWCHEDY